MPQPRDTTADTNDPTDSVHDDPSAIDASGDGAALGSATRTVSLLTLVSRFGGLVRDLTTVRVFGDTPLGSAFTAAFAVPNLFRRLFGEGALAAAFLPEYSSAAQDDPQRADRFASLTVLVLLLVTGAILVVLEAAVLVLLVVLPPDADRQVSLGLMAVLLPFMPLVCVAAILGAMLHVHGRFAPAAAAPIILNVLMIAAASLHFIGPRFEPRASAYAIGIAALIAGFVQIAWCVWSLRGKVHWTHHFAGVGASTKRMLGRFVPVAIGLGTVQVNALLDMVIAMWPNWVGPTIAGLAYPLDVRSNAILGYTQRLYQFPLGVFGIAVATAAFPLLTRHARDPGRFVASLRRALTLSLFIALPAQAGLMLVRGDLVAVMFGGGGSGFSDQGVTRAAWVLLGYSSAIWAYSLNHVLVRAFYAQGDMRTPMRIAIAAVGLNLVLNLTLIWPLREAGLAWSTAIAAMAQTVALWLRLRRSVARPILDRSAQRSIRRAVLATAIMTAVLIAVAVLWPTATTWGGHLARLVVLTGVGGGVYLGLAIAWRSEPLRMMIGRGSWGGDA